MGMCRGFRGVFRRGIAGGIGVLVESCDVNFGGGGMRHFGAGGWHGGDVSPEAM